MRKYKYISLLVTLSAIGASLLSACTSSQNNSSTVTEISVVSGENTVSSQQDNNIDGTTAKQLRNAIAKAYGENYLPKVEIEPDVLQSEFGLTPDMYDECVAEAPMIGFHPDRLVIVKAKQGKEAEVKRALENALTAMKEELMQYPMNEAKVNAARVLDNSGYYCFMLLGKADDVSENDDEAARFAEQQMEIGVKAFENFFADKA